MFGFGRLLALGILGLVVYMGFFSLPPGEPGDGHFDPATLAAQEVAVWKAAKAHEEVGVYTAVAVMLRERHHYSWFRAAQSAYYLGRATGTFETLKTRYERVLPDLEDAAAIHKAWVGAPFDPAAVARAQLTWWVTRRLPNLNSLDQLTPLIVEEYTRRYGISEGAAAGVASRRAEAVLLFDSGGPDPDTTAVTRALTDSNLLLQRAILQPRKVR